MLVSLENRLKTLPNGLFTLPDLDSDPCTDPDTCTMQKFHIGLDPDSDSEGFPYVYVS